MLHVELRRVVVASPSDVQAERDSLPGVLEDLNHGLAGERGLRLELARWETDAYPGFHVDGPQALIDAVLRIEDCDVLIGIFWKHFGTPVQDADSGTEHEFRRAYAAWQQTGRPHMMVYFNQRAYTPKSRTETDQWGRVLDFQEHFPREGLWWTYRGKPQFEKLVRRHLNAFIRDYTPRPPETPGAGAGPAPAPLTPGAVAALRRSYLTWLMAQVRAVPLAGIDPKSIREETRRDLDLAAVYTALMTQRSEDAMPPGLIGPGGYREREPLSALAVANAEPRLALLGDPGSGKSTFVNFMALCMAGELLGQPDANLTVLRAAVPQDRDDEARRDGQDGPPQPWDHGALMPIRVLLREFVAHRLLPAGPNAAVSGETLWQEIVETLPTELRDLAQPLREELDQIGGLLLLDGLDEVPEADQRRVQVKTVVEQFATLFPRVRILVTSRTYAYQRQEWKLRGFAEAGLTPFSPAQIRAFVERWHAHVGPARGLSADDIQAQSLLLNDAIRRNPRLAELAARPLLLTLMASLHAWRQGKLPDQREELYADAVELLLDLWESRKLRRKPDGTYETIEPSVGEWLRVDRNLVRQALNRLAFEAHRDQAQLVGTADIAQNTLESALLRLTPDLDARPGRLIEFLRDRAGLLEPRGVGIYAFPHRTFQEYLAACHLTEGDDFPYNLADLLRADPNRWREVTLLAGAKAVRGAVPYAWLLTDALCPKAPPHQKQADESGYWGALLTAQVLTESPSLRATIAERNPPKVEHIRQWLVRTLRHGALSPVDRAQAGDALAIIGDPRFRAATWYLPDEPLLGFVEIPAGPFRMGSNGRRDQDAADEEKPQHEVRLPRYFIARYPVTVAQFRAFVEDTGPRAEDAQSLQGLANHPVVGVTWYRALDYCTWLTARLQAWPGTPEPLATLLRQEGWPVLLPSEAEWEKAARGTDGRIFPWGKEGDTDRANYYETGIDTTSAVGCFPRGASPYGVEDVIGNVWEWTRSLSGDDWLKPAYRYPYRPDDGREDLEVANYILRVLRGGAFDYDQPRVRCAFRFRFYPDFEGKDIGFRVAVLPGL